MKQARWKEPIILVACFVATLLMLWLLLLASAAIPNGAIRENMTESALSYQTADAFESHHGEHLAGVGDNYADAILMALAYNMGQGDLLEASINTRYYDGEEMGENYGLYLTVTDQAPESNVNYTRYWHGGAAFVRLLHLFTHVEGMKLLGLMVTLLLAFMTVVMLIRYGHRDLALALVLSLLAVRVWNIRYSLEYQSPFLICFFLCPLYLLLERRGDRYLPILSVMGGVMVAFFDFLTTETVTILLPLMLVVALRAAEGRLGSFRTGGVLAMKCLLAWGMSYGAAFLVKWGAATLVTGENQFSLALSSAGYRMAGALAGEGPESLLARIPAAVFSNLSVLAGSEARMDLPAVLLLLGIPAAVLGAVYYLFRGKKKEPAGAAILLLLGCVVLLRYMVLSSHSYLHCFFTHRALICPILAVLLALSINLKLPLFQKGGKRK